MPKNKINNQTVVEINPSSLDWTISQIFQEVKNITGDIAHLKGNVIDLQNKNDERFVAINNKIDASDKKTQDEFQLMKSEVQTIKTDSILNKKDIAMIIGIAIAIGTTVGTLVVAWITSKFK